MLPDAGNGGNGLSVFSATEEIGLKPVSRLGGMALAGICLAILPHVGRASDTPAPAESAPAATAAPAGPGKAVWAADYAQARERARRDGKVVFVEFSEANCGNCIRMHSLIYPAVNFEMMLLRMVPVNVDRLGSEGAALAERYGVTQSPAVLVLSSGGALIFRVNGFDSAPEFYSHVHSMMAEWDKLNVRMIHEPEFQDDPAQELALGIDLAQRFDPEEAIPRFARAAESPRADAATRDQALSYLASAQLNARLFADARVTTEKLARVAHDRDLREQAEIFLGQISLAEGDSAAARRSWEAFLQKHPDSPRRQDAENRIAALSSAAAKGKS
jgi:thiol-disulfide isomerase/thioredoxin